MNLRIWMIWGVLLIAAPAWAQFIVFFYETDQMLTTMCGGVIPIPDGVQVQIMWDRGALGESAEDTLAPLCYAPPECLSGPNGTVNRNTFVMNGVAVEFGAGYFFMEVPMISVGTLPNPNRWYLRICLPTCHWVSNTLADPDGYLEWEMGPWTCYPAPCANWCPAPISPLTFTATDNTTCAGVNLSWSYPDTVALLDKFLLYRDGVLLDSANSLARSYFDSTAVAWTTYLYAISARRHCTDTGYGYSVRVEDNGVRYPLPPVAYSVTASTNICDSVRIAWTFNTSAGVDSFRIKRDGVRVGAILKSGSAGPRSWYHVTAMRGTGVYAVVGWNSVCGEGQASAPATGEALQEPLQVTNVIATDGLCDSTIITWTDVSDEISYRVWRSNADGSDPSEIGFGIPANTVRFRDYAGVAGVQYRYWVVAINPCGTSPASAYDLGWRLTAPMTPSNFTASDGTFCTHTSLSWLDVSTETGYQILRTFNSVTDTMATLPANTTNYNDTTGIPGRSYSYTVWAFNGCGSATSVPNVGTRAVAPDVVYLWASEGTVCEGVLLNWPNTLFEQGYRIYRNGTLIDSAGVDITTYTDYGPLTLGVHYGYTVRAYNFCGEGTPSPVDTGWAIASPIPVCGVEATRGLRDSTVITWTDVTGETSYHVWRSLLSDSEAMDLTVSGLAPNTTRYNDCTGSYGTIYRYWVISTNNCGSSGRCAADEGYRIGGSLPNQGHLSLVQVAEPGVEIESWDFGSVECGVAASRAFRWKNTGTDTVKIQSISLSTSAFSLMTNCPLPLYVAPGQMSACSLYFTFAAQADGEYADTLLVGTNAGNGNGSYWWMYLSGVRTPTSAPAAAPQVVIQFAGMDACLHWPSVDQAVNGCPATVTGYLLFHATQYNGPYAYLGFSTDTSYVHEHTAQFAVSMYYHVITYTGSLARAAEIMHDTPEEVVRRELQFPAPPIPPASGEE
jgi:hypothetical protein